jgi:hypothetical protein
MTNILNLSIPAHQWRPESLVFELLKSAVATDAQYLLSRRKILHKSSGSGFNLGATEAQLEQQQR